MTVSLLYVRGRFFRYLVMCKKITCTTFIGCSLAITSFHHTHSAQVIFLNSNISFPSITILLCYLIRNTCPFNTWYFAKYYYNTFSSHKICTTLLCEVRLHLGNKNERLLVFHFVLRSVCTTLLCEVRLHLGNKNKRLLVFHFVLRLVCTNFALETKQK